jgi:hypothetical protein
VSVARVYALPACVFLVLAWGDVAGIDAQHRRSRLLCGLAPSQCR